MAKGIAKKGATKSGKKCETVRERDPEAGKFTAVKTGRVVKSLPMPPRLGESRIRNAVRAVVKK